MNEVEINKTKEMKNIKNIRLGAYTYNGETYPFNFGTDITTSGKLTFVNSVVNTIVDDGDYNSIIKDLIFDYMIVQLFTDYDTDDINNSENIIDSIEQLLSETNIVDIVKINMEESLIEELNNAIDKAIEYKTGIHSNPLSDSLASLFKTIEKKVNEIDMTNIMDMAKKFASMNGDFTPESIVNAYINSDMHKNSIAEIEDAKKKRTEFAKDMDKAIKLVKEESKSKNKVKSKSKDKK